MSVDSASSVRPYGNVAVTQRKGPPVPPKILSEKEILYNLAKIAWAEQELEKAEKWKEFAEANFAAAKIEAQKEAELYAIGKAMVEEADAKLRELAKEKAALAQARAQLNQQKIEIAARKAQADEKIARGNALIASGNEKKASGNKKIASGNAKKESGNEKIVRGNELIASGNAKEASGNAKKESGNEKIASAIEKKKEAEEMLIKIERNCQIAYKKIDPRINHLSKILQNFANFKAENKIDNRISNEIEKREQEIKNLIGKAELLKNDVPKYSIAIIDKRIKEFIEEFNMLCQKCSQIST